MRFHVQGAVKALSSIAQPTHTQADHVESTNFGIHICPPGEQDFSAKQFTPSTHCLRLMDRLIDNSQPHQTKPTRTSNRYGLQLIKTPPQRPILNTLPMPLRRLPARQKDSEEIPRSIQEARKAGPTKEVRRRDYFWRHHVLSGVCAISLLNLTIFLDGQV
jgi:hypothetical protein